MVPHQCPVTSAVSPPTAGIKMYVRSSGQLTLPVADLQFLQATGNYTWLHWRDGQRMLMPRTLKYYIPLLPADWFIRLHRNCVVNLDCIERIERIDPDKGGLVYLRSGVVLPVSRRRWFATKRLLARHSLSN
ncbi:LytR/AlgR family response regulator transcription factor [Spirosoma aerophilum]